MTISVLVPASTTNLGPGFDCLGIALRLGNRITVGTDRSERPVPGMVEQAADLSAAPAKPDSRSVSRLRAMSLKLEGLEAVSLFEWAS